MLVPLLALPVVVPWTLENRAICPTALNLMVRVLNTLAIFADYVHFSSHSQFNSCMSWVVWWVSCCLLELLVLDCFWYPGSWLRRRPIWSERTVCNVFCHFVDGIPDFEQSWDTTLFAAFLGQPVAFEWRELVRVVSDGPNSMVSWWVFEQLDVRWPLLDNLEVAQVFITVAWLRRIHCWASCWAFWVKSSCDIIVFIDLNRSISVCKDVLHWRMVDFGQMELFALNSLRFSRDSNFLTKLRFCRLLFLDYWLRLDSILV